MLGQSASLPPVASPRSHEDLLNLIALVTDPKKVIEALDKLAAAQKTHDACRSELDERAKSLADQDAELQGRVNAHMADVDAHLRKVSDAERGWAELEAQRQTFAGEKSKAEAALAMRGRELDAKEREASDQVSRAASMANAAGEVRTQADQRHAAAVERERTLDEREALLTARQKKLAEALAATT